MLESCHSEQRKASHLIAFGMLHVTRLCCRDDMPCERCSA